MKAAVERALSDPSVWKAMDDLNKSSDFKQKTVKGYVRDWGLLLLWTGSTTVIDVTMPSFFAAMEAFVGKYSLSRVENFRSAVVWVQSLDPSLRQEQRWSKQEYFRIRFNGLLARVDAAYKEKQEEGELPQTKRGRIQEEKLRQLVDFCVQKGEDMYAIGFVLSYNLLLRHQDLVKLTGDSIRYLDQRGWEVRIVGGKDRPADFEEWIDGSDCPKVLQRLMEERGKTEPLVPKWSEDKANRLIREAAHAFGWSTEGERYVHHCARRGKARDLYEEGLTIPEIMERGRWGGSKITLDYVGRDVTKS